MDNEERFARLLCRALDRGTTGLDSALAERLRAARERALACQPVAASAGLVIDAGGVAHLGHPDDESSHPWRSLLLVLVMLLGMGLAYYWNSSQQAEANEEIDSALLADDLSPKALLDPGFQAWLSHYVQDSTR